MIYRFEVRCYSKGKLVRTLQFFTLKDAEKWTYVNKCNYDRVIIHTLY